MFRKQSMYNRGNRVDEGYIRDYDDTASMASTAVSSTSELLPWWYNHITVYQL